MRPYGPRPRDACPCAAGKKTGAVAVEAKDVGGNKMKWKRVGAKKKQLEAYGYECAGENGGIVEITCLLWRTSEHPCICDSLK